MRFQISDFRFKNSIQNSNLKSEINLKSEL
jgi:hypothetical protein